jgi:hypothetical protein
VTRALESVKAGWLGAVLTEPQSPGHQVRTSKPRLVEVAVEAQPAAGFARALGNGRRIESSWKFAESDPPR